MLCVLIMFDINVIEKNLSVRPRVRRKFRTHMSSSAVQTHSINRYLQRTGSFVSMNFNILMLSFARVRIQLFHTILYRSYSNSDTPIQLIIRIDIHNKIVIYIKNKSFKSLE